MKDCKGEKMSSEINELQTSKTDLIKTRIATGKFDPANIEKDEISLKIEFRQHRDRNIHAKVYISRFKKDDRDFGRVITGSSNFSHSGLKAQHEFNVELKVRADVETALEHFENLWSEGIDISQEYINTLDNKTLINDAITPYELYLKMLYEYFFERINLDKETSFVLPEGYFNLEYQTEAVNAAIQILNQYNGVFLADVVGLGKTFAIG